MARGNGPFRGSNFESFDDWYSREFLSPSIPDVTTFTETKSSVSSLPFSSTVFLTAAGLASTVGFGTANLKLKISAAGLASTVAFGTSNIKVEITATGLASTAGFGTSKFGLGITASGLASTAALGASNLKLKISPAGLASTAAFGSATISPTFVIKPDGLASTVAFGTSSLQLKINASGLASTAALGTASLEDKISATGIASTVAFGTAKLTLQINATGLASTLAFGTTLLVSPIAPTGLASTVAFGTAKLTLQIGATGLASTLAFGTSRIRNFVPEMHINPTGLPSTLRFGNAGIFAHITPSITSHCELGKARLLEQFKTSPKISSLICLLSDQIQAMEQASADVLAYRSLTTSFGADLDGLGQNLQLPRHGVSDAEYRRYLSAKTRIIDSRGRPDEILSVMVLLDNNDDLPSVSLREEPPNCVIVTCTVPAGYQLRGEFFAYLLKQMVPACVRLILEFEERDTDLFEWDESMTGLGWDEVDGGGGTWAEAV